MLYVKPNTLGENGLGPIDPDRRDQLPGKTWRAVPPNSYPYWQRMANNGDVRLSEDPPEDEREGYEAPPILAVSKVAPAAAAAAPAPVVPKV